MGAKATQSIHYHLSWPEPDTHYYHVEITIIRSKVGRLYMRMPAWRPGRYIIQNYARYVIDFEAKAIDGKPLNFKKSDKNTWEVAASLYTEIVVRYKVYANVLDAGESYLDGHEAYLNPISALMYGVGFEFTPSLLTFDKSPDWSVATALDYDEEKNGYLASDYHELVDSPFIISPDFTCHSFSHDGATYELIFQGQGNYDPDTVIDQVSRIVRVQTKIMGVTPFKRYVFLYHLLPERFGHGVEHKNSTCIVVGPPLFNEPEFIDLYLGLTSHEFFHLWVVERIRPEAMYHPDYGKEVYTTTMWVYEGITSYYTELVLVKAGLMARDTYFDRLANTLRRYDSELGRKVKSVAMVSWDSWISSSSPPNTTYSFYLAGHVLGLLLDLEIRGRTGNGRSLNDVFRFLYAEYAEKDIGVPEDGFKKALEAVSQSSFSLFFEKYVYGMEDIDYNTFLKHAGLILNKYENEEGFAHYYISTIENPQSIQQQILDDWLKETV